MNKKNNVSEKIFEMIKRACSEWDKPWSKMPDDEKEMAIDDYIKIYEEGKKECCQMCQKELSQQRFWSQL